MSPPEPSRPHLNQDIAMNLLNRIFGTEPEPEPEHDGAIRRARAMGSDAYTLERYRYMLQTAPPETIEQAHAEAFDRLTPDQRRQVLTDLAEAAPEHEREAIEHVSADDPQALARTATRAEVLQPGIMERTLGTSMGAGFGASLLGSFAAGFAGSVVANSFFASLAGIGVEGDVDDDGSVPGVGDQEEFDGGSFDAINFDL
jgi:hypothetical protein